MNRHQRRAWKHRRKVGKVITIEIDFKYTQEVQHEVERGGKKIKEKTTESSVKTRTFPLEIDDLPLTLCEALEAENIGQMRAGITEYLGLTDEESRQLRLKHVKQISQAIRDAQAIPNG